MDGVIIDSEPLWRKAMIKAFNELGINFTEEDCIKTTGMRIHEVIEHWQIIYPSQIKSPSLLKTSIHNYLINYINQEGKALPGFVELLDFLKKNNYKIGLATSSDNVLIEAVLSKLNVADNFDALISAEDLTYGKPHPEVYLHCANLLGVIPQQCLVIEDSINGIISALAAQMKVLGIPDYEQLNNVKFKVATGIISHLGEVKDFLLAS